MYRIDQLRVLVVQRDIAQRGKDMLHRLSVVLSPVTGDKHNFFARVVQRVENICRKCIVFAHRRFQRVDDRVAGDKDTVLNTLLPEVVPIVFCWAKVEIGNLRHQLAVHFLRKGRILVIGAKPSLNVPYGHLMIKCRKRAGESRRRIAVDEDHIWLQPLDHIVHTREALAGDG